MIGNLIRRWHGLRTPLRVNILVLFLAVLVPLSAAVITYNYFATRSLALDAIAQRVQEISDRIVERQQRFMLPATSLAQIYAYRYGDNAQRALEDPGFAGGVLQSMVLFPQLYAVYVGYDNGEFVHVVKFSKEELAQPGPNPIPPGARYAVRKITFKQKDRADTWQFLDENHKPLAVQRRQVTFDPRGRPWYYAALRADGAITAGPYRFAASGQEGITFSRPLAAGPRGVVGVDMITADLSAFLMGLRVGKSGHILIFGENGALIASTPGLRALQSPSTFAPQPADGGTMPPTAAAITANTDALPPTPLSDELLTLFMQMMPSKERSRIRATIQNVDYLVDMQVLRLTPMVSFRVVVLAPVDEFLGPIARISAFTVAISAAIGLLAIPLVFFLAKRIAKPMLALSNDARRIQQMELEPQPPLNSSVSELHDLADSFTAMKSTLNSVTKYVPLSVVRELMESHTEPVPGGAKRTISILFTDVRDFTKLSEGMAPDDLLRKASTYFQEVGSSILGSGGLIGRFMGDGILAYWNAPQDDPDHAIHAVAAVLRSRSNSEALNRRWESYGWPIMHTRYGLHVGEAVVGNVGTPDRLDYTAFGDCLNIASRLEGLNKFYGTQILVSGTMANALNGAVVLRWVDRAAPKGSTLPLDVLELVGMRGDDEFTCASPLQVRMATLWNEQVVPAYLARRWDDALLGIQEYQAAFPNDPLSKLFTERCTRLRKDNPGETWDGVVRYTEK